MSKTPIKNILGGNGKSRIEGKTKTWIWNLILKRSWRHTLNNLELLQSPFYVYFLHSVALLLWCTRRRRVMHYPTFNINSEKEELKCFLH